MTCCRIIEGLVIEQRVALDRADQRTGLRLALAFATRLRIVVVLQEVLLEVTESSSS